LIIQIKTENLIFGFLVRLVVGGASGTILSAYFYKINNLWHHKGGIFTK